MKGFEQIKEIEAIENKYSNFIGKDNLSTQLMKMLDELPDGENQYEKNDFILDIIDFNYRFLNAILLGISITITSGNLEDAKILSKSDNFRESINYNDMYRMMLKSLKGITY